MSGVGASPLKLAYMLGREERQMFHLLFFSFFFFFFGGGERVSMKHGNKVVSVIFLWQRLLSCQNLNFKGK